MFIVAVQIKILPSRGDWTSGRTPMFGFASYRRTFLLNDSQAFALKPQESWSNTFYLT